MNKIGIFEKVSFPQFWLTMKSEFHTDDTDEKETFAIINHEYEKLKVPKRATAGSAGYDFYAPFTFVLHPGESIRIPTGIRAVISEGWFLMCVPRSGLGFKYHLRLANTAAIVDADYAFSDNEGHIFIKLVNEGGKTIQINAGDAFAQGIFLPFGITDDDDATEIRNGGLGSTD